MIFYFYLGAMGFAVVLSLFNLRRGDMRLTMMAGMYMAIIALFHMFFFHYNKQLEFYLMCACAQGAIGVVAREIWCKAAKLIYSLSIIAVTVNLFTFIVEAHYPHAWYFYTINFIQCSQIASLILASAVWQWTARQIGLLRKKNHEMHRVAHERLG